MTVPRLLPTIALLSSLMILPMLLSRADDHDGCEGGSEWPEVDTIAHRQLIQQRLRSLLEEPSPRALLRHHDCVLNGPDMSVVAIELLSLRHGDDWSSTAIEYLSERSTTAGGVNDYARAAELGRWLGSMRVASEQSPGDRSANAAWLRSLLDSILRQTASPEAGNFPVPVIDATVVDDVLKGQTSLGEGLDLLAYGDITVSSITTVIGQSLRSVKRKSGD